MEGGKQVKLKGGKLMHTYRTLSEEIFHFFMEAWRLEDGGNEKMVLAGISHWDRAGVICMLNKVCMQL